MLEALSIKGIVLIDQLELKFDTGFTVLTGETGAGKSILLDALGLVLGERGQIQLINPRHNIAQITAVFTLGDHHPVWQIMTQHQLPIDDATVILRRTLAKDGKTRAYVNDQVVTLNLLKEIGSELVEIHGQFDHLLNPKSHLQALDRFAHTHTLSTTSIQQVDSAINDKDLAFKHSNDENVKNNNAERDMVQAFYDFTAAQQTLAKALTNRDQAVQDHEFTQNALSELHELNVHDNEETRLKLERDFLVNHSKIVEQLQFINQKLYLDSGADGLIRDAMKYARKIADIASDRFENIYTGLDRAAIELDEVRHIIDQNLERSDADDNQLEVVEQRLQKLRTTARKYDTTVEALPILLQRFEDDLALLTSSTQHFEQLQHNIDRTRQKFVDLAIRRRHQRQQAGQQLALAIKRELTPLKLDKAEVQVWMEDLPETAWNATGMDYVEFKIQPNPGLPLGPLSKIASGGERARFMLALKVILAGKADRSLLIFDEIDAGVGGAVATAIGDRMAKLGHQTQVLAITHAPQVAACADNHFVVSKEMADQHTVTHVKILNHYERQEEIARMLAGEMITPEARAAAAQLLHQNH